MSYFETITDASKSHAKRQAEQNINEIRRIPAASSWSTAELYAARLLVRTAKQDGRCDHVLPALREHFDETVRNHARTRELLRGPAHLDGMTETELVHLYGEGSGTSWSALVTFGDVVEQSHEGGDQDDSSKRPHSSDSEASFVARTQGKRVRTQREREGFVDSSFMQVGSSSLVARPAPRGPVLPTSRRPTTSPNKPRCR